MPILAFVFVVFCIYILNVVLGVDAKLVLGNNLFYGTITGISGLIALCLLILKFLHESKYESQITNYNKCISFLEKAQTIANNLEVSNNFLQPKQHGKKQSLMAKLKSIRIDAPEDFATNLELYVSGEKRAESDLRLQWMSKCSESGRLPHSCITLCLTSPDFGTTSPLCCPNSLLNLSDYQACLLQKHLSSFV